MAVRDGAPSDNEAGPCRTLYGAALALEGGAGDLGGAAGRGIDGGIGGGAAVGVDDAAEEGGGGPRRLNGTDVGGAEAALVEAGTGDTSGGL